MGWQPTLETPLLPFFDGVTARARFSVTPRPPAELPHEPRLLAGAATVDITPPPGMPKAGYSANAHDGAGFRTRLRARVVHLRAGHASMALVACDLLGGSAVVQHLVAEAIAERTDVPLAGVWIGATHTHAGPGQFLGTDFYNRFASNRSGFDPAYAQLLVERIAGAVVDAVETRRPARLALGATEVWGLTRNRSLEPHVQNETVTDERLDPQRKFVAVNPLLHLLRVDADEPDGGTSPLAALAVFSVHGTGISMRDHDYNADLWAYLVGELDQRIEQAAGRRAVVGAMEGTHADVAPALRPGQAGPLEAARVGRGIGAEAADLWTRLEGELAGDVVLGAGLRELDLRGGASIDGIDLPARPAVGAALVAGAHENVTPVIHRIPPFRAGSPKPARADDPQGAKWVLGGRFQNLVVPLRSFPHVLPLQVLRIGDATLVGLPFELTVETGRRIAAEVAGLGGAASADHVVVSSVVNEYSGYIATAEEYGRQHYEGGHTLYGPNTQRFMARHAGLLAAEVAVVIGSSTPVVSDPVEVRSFDLAVHRYLPGPEPDSFARRWIGEARFVDPTRDEDGFWEQTWTDTAPGNLLWHEPMVEVEAADGDQDWRPARHHGRAVDDQRGDLAVRSLGLDRVTGRPTYRVRWYDPAFRDGRRHRFVLLDGDRREPGPAFD